MWMAAWWSNREAGITALQRKIYMSLWIQTEKSVTSNRGLQMDTDKQMFKSQLSTDSYSTSSTERKQKMLKPSSTCTWTHHKQWNWQAMKNIKESIIHPSSAPLILFRVARANQWVRRGCTLYCKKKPENTHTPSRKAMWPPICEAAVLITAVTPRNRKVWRKTKVKHSWGVKLAVVWVICSVKACVEWFRLKQYPPALSSTLQEKCSN